MFTKKSISRIFSVLFVIVFMLAITPLQAAHAAGVRYAKPSATGTGNCLSWANACTLQTALTSAVSGDEIWAAAGTYKPTTNPTNRTATFHLKNGLALYGGFAGTETARDQRNPAVNVTVLSGDIDNNDSQTPIITHLTTVTGNTTNSYHVVIGATGATLIGFTITAGNANGSYPDNDGGGMFNDYQSSPTLTNVTFSGNSAQFGGGMYNYSNSPTLTNVTFSGNSAHSGGGMYNYSNSPTLTNVTFNGNSATSEGGGMSNNYQSSPTLTNVTFSDNSAGAGGGMSNSESNPPLTNVTFNGNSAQLGGGMYNYSSSNPTLTNVTFSGNTATNHYGGGMYNNASSSPTLTNVTFSDNSAVNGGGMGNWYNCNPALTNVTFNGNSAQLGGGMYNYNNSPTLTNVTFSDNSATIYGGGMDNNFSSSPTIHNTIFWGNTATSDGAQIYNDASSPVVNDSIVQGGYAGGTNIITADPRLGTLGNFGGFTQTIPLLAYSSAINMGNDLTCAVTDQRGIARPQGAHCDIGAFELVDNTPPNTNIDSQNPATTPTNSISMTFTFSGTDTDSGVKSFECDLDGGGFATCASPKSYASLPDGSHTFQVRAIDFVGNVDASPASHTWTVDTTTPTVISSLRANANPTSAASVDFTVTISESVTGVGVTDFSLTTTGVSGASVTSVSGSGSVYTVTANTGSGNGTIRLDVPTSATITDLAGNLLASPPYTGGETYTITKVYIFLPLILR
jgi:hypothetical protein